MGSTSLLSNATSGIPPQGDVFDAIVEKPIEELNISFLAEVVQDARDVDHLGRWMMDDLRRTIRGNTQICELLEKAIGGKMLFELQSESQSKTKNGEGVAKKEFLDKIKGREKFEFPLDEEPDNQ